MNDDFMTINVDKERKITLNAAFINSYALIELNETIFDDLLKKATDDYLPANMSYEKAKYYIIEFGNNSKFGRFAYVKQTKDTTVKKMPKQISEYIDKLKKDPDLNIALNEAEKWQDSSIIVTDKKGNKITYSYVFIFERLKKLSSALIDVCDSSCDWFNELVTNQVNDFKEKKLFYVVPAKKFDQNYLAEYFWYKIKFHYIENPISLSVFFNLTDKSSIAYKSLIHVAIEVHESQTKKISSFYKEKVNQAIDIILNSLNDYNDKNLICAYADSYGETEYQSITKESLEGYKKEPLDNNKRLHVGYIVARPEESFASESVIGERIHTALEVLSDLCEKISFSTTIEREIYETLYVRSKKQMVLHGAPGTGKTYGAKLYVKQATGNDDERVRVVQFHPSYDYTDFVEGIRPVTENDGPDKKMIFVKMDGDFKSFCRKIVEASLIRVLKDANLKNVIKNIELYKNYGLDEEYIDKLDTLKLISFLEKKEQKLDDKQLLFLNVLMETLYFIAKNEQTENDELAEEKKQLISLFNSIHDVSNIKSEGDSAEEDDSDDEDDGSKDYDPGQEERAEDSDDETEFYYDVDNSDDNGEIPYYFIIDEVNRADISKVFGELMYGFEYRGIQNRFATQYSQLSIVYTKNKGEFRKLQFDCFENGFFVPENLVVIGTMNDIDKSVESFDFAMRRRFHWIHIKADDVMEEVLKGIFSKTVDIKKNTVNDTIALITSRMNAMNKYLVTEGAKFGLDDDYKIGPDYLKDFYNYKGKKHGEKNVNTNQALKKVFELSIEPTIREYLRGQKQDKVNTLIDNCEKILKDSKKKKQSNDANNANNSNVANT